MQQKGENDVVCGCFNRGSKNSERGTDHLDHLVDVKGFPSGGRQSGFLRVLKARCSCEWINLIEGYACKKKKKRSTNAADPKKRKITMM